LALNLSGAMDWLTPSQRSRNMRAIRAKNTKPELAVRRSLHALGFRFRLHISGLPGRPDIVMRKRQLIIHVKGCFWHGHRCLKRRIPEGNRAYWLKKILGNKSRDRRNARRLRSMGWRAVTLWECDIRRWKPKQLEAKLKKLIPRSTPQRSRRQPVIRALSTRR